MPLDPPIPPTPASVPASPPRTPSLPPPLVARLAPPPLPPALPLPVARPVARRMATAIAPFRVVAWLRQRRRRFAGRHASWTSFAASTLLHALLVLVLGLMYEADDRLTSRARLLVRLAEPEPSNAAIVTELVEPPSIPRDMPTAVVAVVPSVRIESLAAAGGSSVPQSPSRSALDEPIDLQPVATAGSSGSAGAHRLAGRDGPLREQLLAAGGGTRASELAVARGLRWLQAHQRSDGGWHFNHQGGTCQGLCRDPGVNRSTTAATSLAILAFLGAGQTPSKGDYQDCVRQGLDYLIARMHASDHGGDFQEGTMYAQGLAALALCEAHAMTGDAALRAPAQAAIDFIVFAQDKKGGGWRYVPGEPGDLSVTGWQLMALKSGQLSYKRIPSETLLLAERFLDAMQTDKGAFYGYTSAGKEPTMTAVGLLCRMVGGWPRSHASLERGVRFLTLRGPSKNDLYYDYYATQVLFHWGGSEWRLWNDRMRDLLVDSQASAGHESGSWYFDDDHHSGQQGGRHYNTCLAIMTLEVYYRYLPIYGKYSVDESY